MRSTAPSLLSVTSPTTAGSCRHPRTRTHAASALSVGGAAAGATNADDGDDDGGDDGGDEEEHDEEDVGVGVTAIAQSAWHASSSPTAVRR